MRSRSTAALAPLLLLALGAPGVARAQPADDAARARALYRQGAAAARRGRWDEAARAFRESRELAPSPRTLARLAGAEAEAGHLVAAAASYRELLAAAPARRAARRAERALAELEGRIAHVELSIEGLRDDDRIELDGSAIPHASLAAALPLDPGRHTVVVLRGGDVVGLEELEVAEGQRTDLSVELITPAAAAVEEPAEGPARAAAPRPAATPAAGGDDLALPVGLGVGAGLLVAAGVVVAILFATGAVGAGGFSGNLQPGAVTFE